MAVLELGWWVILIFHFIKTGPHGKLGDTSLVGNTVTEQWQLSWTVQSHAVMWLLSHVIGYLFILSKHHKVRRNWTLYCLIVTDIDLGIDSIASSLPSSQRGIIHWAHTCQPWAPIHTVSRLFPHKRDQGAWKLLKNIVILMKWVPKAAILFTLTWE